MATSCGCSVKLQLSGGRLERALRVSCPVAFVEWISGASLTDDGVLNESEFGENTTRGAAQSYLRKGKLSHNKVRI